MHITIKPFVELNTYELYAMLRLRSAVFVVEQDCVYQDIDNKDAAAIHVMGFSGDQLVAYARIFQPGDYFDQSSIGRVVVDQSARGKAYGKQIMQASMNYLIHRDMLPIKISAQCYLNTFYSELGFSKVGEEYLEDGIPHQAMIYTTD